MHIEIGQSLECEKPISLQREEIRVKLATGLTLCCAHLASLAEIQGKATAEDRKRDYDTNCPEFAPWVVTHLKAERATRFPPLCTRVLLGHVSNLWTLSFFLFFVLCFICLNGRQNYTGLLLHASLFKQRFVFEGTFYSKFTFSYSNLPLTTMSLETLVTFLNLHCCCWV